MRASTSASTSETSTPSVIGAMPATTSRVCGACFSRMSPMTTSWPPERPIPFVNSSSVPSQLLALPSSGRARLAPSMRLVLMPTTRIASWLESIPSTSVQLRSSFSSVIPPRPIRRLDGSLAPPSRNWSARWSRRTSRWSAVDGIPRLRTIKSEMMMRFDLMGTRPLARNICIRVDITTYRTWITTELGLQINDEIHTNIVK
mmetsp:Transcript_17848/g.51097  ORF Transcript_17848/g.51097 Transcript_17848/m.51097 type:complete len:202 (+) Transcript_17848:689-1294(+)